MMHTYVLFDPKEGMYYNGMNPSRKAHIPWSVSFTSSKECACRYVGVWADDEIQIVRAKSGVCLVKEIV